MFNKTCKCGQSHKNFKVDIGPFFVGECCALNGYDDFGNLKVSEAPIPKKKTLGQKVSENLKRKPKRP